MEGQSKLNEIIGNNLLQVGEDSAIKTISFNDFKSSFSGKFVGFYFGAHWAPPSRLFTKTLDTFYKDVNANGKQLEVVFVTDDRESKHFESNFSKMPWLSIPYDDEHKKQILKSRFGVAEIPTLVIVSAEECQVITHDGRDDISKRGGAIADWEKILAAKTEETQNQIMSN